MVTFSQQRGMNSSDVERQIYKQQLRNPPQPQQQEEVLISVDNSVGDYNYGYEMGQKARMTGRQNWNRQIMNSNQNKGYSDGYADYKNAMANADPYTLINPYNEKRVTITPIPQTIVGSKTEKATVGNKISRYNSGGITTVDSNGVITFNKFTTGNEEGTPYQPKGTVFDPNMQNKIKPYVAPTVNPNPKFKDINWLETISPRRFSQDYLNEIQQVNAQTYLDYKNNQFWNSINKKLPKPLSQPAFFKEEGFANKHPIASQFTDLIPDFTSASATLKFGFVSKFIRTGTEQKAHQLRVDEAIKNTNKLDTKIDFRSKMYDKGKITNVDVDAYIKTGDKITEKTGRYAVTEVEGTNVNIGTGIDVGIKYPKPNIVKTTPSVVTTINKITPVELVNVVDGVKQTYRSEFGVVSKSSSRKLANSYTAQLPVGYEDGIVTITKKIKENAKMRTTVGIIEQIEGTNKYNYYGSTTPKIKYNKAIISDINIRGIIEQSDKYAKNIEFKSKLSNSFNVNEVISKKATTTAKVRTSLTDEGIPSALSNQLKRLLNDKRGSTAPTRQIQKTQIDQVRKEVSRALQGMDFETVRQTHLNNILKRETKGIFTPPAYKTSFDNSNININPPLNRQIQKLNQLQKQENKQQFFYTETQTQNNVNIEKQISDAINAQKLQTPQIQQYKYDTVQTPILPKFNMPTFNLPPVILPPIPNLDGYFQKKRKKKELYFEDTLNTMDFTSKILGISEKKTQKNFNKTINKILTGLEVRY